jgi:hypothetical protein
MSMKIMGVDAGYDEPLWYLGPWEFGIFDNGWLVAKDRIIRLEGKWPTWRTFHKRRG